jgi:hypothetical protein
MDDGPTVYMLSSFVWTMKNDMLLSRAFSPIVIK